MKFQRIVFLQGDEADKVLTMWNEDHHKALEYMLQWDNGDGDIENFPSAGTSDFTKDIGEYRITYNHRLEYIGLERLLKY